MVPNQPAMHCVCFWFNCLWICSRMFNFKAQVNFIFCIPHIDHGSLLLKSQKNVLAHGWCWWKFCLATVHRPEQNANKWRLNLGNFQQTFFGFFALSDFTILKCGPNLLKHISKCHHASPPTQPQSSSSVQQPQPQSSSVQQMLPQSSSVQQMLPQSLLGPAAIASVFLGPADAASVLLGPTDAASVFSSVQQTPPQSSLLGPADAASVLLGPADATSVPPRSSRCWLSLLCLEFTQKMKTMTGN